MEHVMLPLIWWEVFGSVFAVAGESIPSFIWFLQTTHRLIPSVGQNRSLRNCTLKTIWIKYGGWWLSLVMLCCGEEGGWGGKYPWESGNKGDSWFGGIVVWFLFQGRGAGNRTSSVDGLLYFLSAVSAGN